MFAGILSCNRFIFISPFTAALPPSRAAQLAPALSSSSRTLARTGCAPRRAERSAMTLPGLWRPGRASCIRNSGRSFVFLVRERQRRRLLAHGFEQFRVAVELPRWAIRVRLLVLAEALLSLRAPKALMG